MIGAVVPSLFVVVPCYNEAAGIAATLEALARQSDPVFILLLVDNASTDGTVAAIEAFRAARPKMDIRIAAEPEKGTGAAADTGFRAAIAAGIFGIPSATRFSFGTTSPPWAAAKAAESRPAAIT